MTRKYIVLISGLGLIAGLLLVFGIVLGSPVPIVLVDLVGGFVAGIVLRRWFVRVVVCVAWPLLIAVICARPRDLLFASGEVHGGALMILIGLFGLGLLGAAVGLLLGCWSRGRMSPPAV